MQTSSQITPLLVRWQEGDREALEELWPLVYQQLSQIARTRMRDERAGHTFATADLVQEAYIKLFGHQNSKWVSRAHFFAVAARAMRHILINYAHRRNAQKRGGAEFERAAVALQELSDRPQVLLCDLDEAITRLEQRDSYAALVVELRFFCGFTTDEMAEYLPMSPATIKRKLRFARIWLDRALR